MYKTLVVIFAVFMIGCGRGDDSNGGESTDPDPKARALARRSEGISPEFLEGLVAKMEQDYPPTGHNTWALVDDLLSVGDRPSPAVFEKRLRQVVLKALRVKAENIFGIVCIGRDPPGTDDLKFVLTNRTGRNVAGVNGVIQVRTKFGNTIESLKLSADKPIAPGGELACGGHWSLPSALMEQLASGDGRYELKFVAAKVTFGDGTVEQFPGIVAGE
ncbi:MAG: hypothetical protein QGG42_12775 [Phycisphaerae bacterium]|jgi:hypothetical protein|nr:hypothetical protein [Phycisphaerae bacterium]